MPDATAEIEMGEGKFKCDSARISRGKKRSSGSSRKPMSNNKKSKLPNSAPSRRRMLKSKEPMENSS